MTLTFSVGLTSLPMPRADNPWRAERLSVGSQFRAANGALKTQVAAQKWRVPVTWEGLSAAERQTLFDVFNALLLTPQLVTFPDGLTFTAYTTLGAWSEQPGVDPWSGAPFYSVSFTFEEA